METLVQIRKDETRSSDIRKLLVRLNRTYNGKWVAILASGEVIAKENLSDLYSEAAKKSSEILALFRASKKGQLMYK